MANNHKLSAFLQGGILESVKMEHEILTISFDHGNVMAVKVGEPFYMEANSKFVTKVRQEGTSLVLDFADNSFWQIIMAADAGCVVVSDLDHNVVYED